MLSRGARWTIGVVAGGSAVTMAAIAPQLPKPAGAYLFAAFCLVVFILCIVPGSSPITARMIGLTLFVLGVWYFADSVRKLSVPNDSAQRYGTWDAIEYLVYFGLPGGYLLIWGRLPHWTGFYRGFHSEDAGNAGTP